MAVLSMKQFLEAGAHFGHQTKRWHPAMAPYIYGAKGGIHIIDLRQTLRKLKDAYVFVKKSSAQGQTVLFVGTKPQISRVVREEAERCNSPFVNYRWLGGLLTNFSTVRQSITRLQQYEDMAGEDFSYEGVIKKEALQVERKRVKLEQSLGGVKTMRSLPTMLFVLDAHKEYLAIKEAQKLGLTIVAVADTNCNPAGIDCLIPGNDDSPRAVSLYANVIATAILEGRGELGQSRKQEAPAQEAKVAGAAEQAPAPEAPVAEAKAESSAEGTPEAESATEEAPALESAAGEAPEAVTETEEASA
ncbi:MAG TPA: 30S ribosomal protein S2 [Deltaproteobacteria bacterium]|nr:30S ribosomal protein S2 [Deltaproteobacteria bacterium]